MIAIIFLISISCCVSWNVSNVSVKAIKVLPPNFGVYHAAFPDFGSTEDEVSDEKIVSYERLVGKNIVWAYFSNNWYDELHFPQEEVEEIISAGAIPFIRLMPRVDFVNLDDPTYSLENIIEGDFDAELIRWAEEAKQVNSPLMVEFGTEVNGDWFPWSGEHNGGGGTKEAYGNETLYDGPERFRDAFRHIVELFNEQNVENITWVFHISSYSDPDAEWNNYENYYPGDEYVDWIGVSIYGAITDKETWTDFSDELNKIYPELTDISKEKPLAILEFGVTEDHPNGNKGLWIKDALETILSGEYPRIKAISYWHESWDSVDLRIDSSEESIAFYRNGISSQYFIDHPEILN
jgi:hypothetical protein